jgi:DDE superfamily endonuclease
VTHWSSRLLATRLGIDHATVARAWGSTGMQPWRCEAFKFSTDPELVAKVYDDVVGLYLTPRITPSCCAWTRSPRSRRWTGPRRCCRCSRTAGSSHARLSPPRHHDTVRRAGGRDREDDRDVPAAPSSPGILTFLKQIAQAYPDQDLHLVMDNYAAHKHPAVRDWLATNPRITVHFTPTHASWMNVVEVRFGIIERQAIHRGTFRSVRDLTTKIRDFING